MIKVKDPVNYLIEKQKKQIDPLIEKKDKRINFFK